MSNRTDDTGVIITLLQDILAELHEMRDLLLEPEGDHDDQAREDPAVTLNRDRTRAIKRDACGVACYEGLVGEDHFVGQQTGVCRDWVDGMTWLHGGRPPSFIQIYGDDDLSGLRH